MRAPQQQQPQSDHSPVQAAVVPPTSGLTFGADALAVAEGLLAARNLEPAMAAFCRAQQQGAEPSRCCAGRWLTSMLAGNFAQAWRESDTIRQLGTPDPHALWRGEDLCGKSVIVRCLHGLGDSVQFLRYLPMLQQRAARVILQVPPRLLELAACLGGFDELISWEAEPAWQAQIEVSQLPYFFRTELRQLPIGTHYLHLPAVVHAKADHEQHRRRPRVGVVWTAGEWNPGRSVPLALWSEVLSDERCEFWNLQGGVARAEWGSLHPAEHRANAEDAARGILPLAQVIQSLDLVITVDTLAAHLAGALGKPAWVLLPYAADWRWMVGRDDSPWYSSLRLFRQPRPEDWQSVTDRVRGELNAWLQSRGRAR